MLEVMPSANSAPDEFREQLGPFLDALDRNNSSSSAGEGEAVGATMRFLVETRLSSSRARCLWRCDLDEDARGIRSLTANSSPLSSVLLSSPSTGSKRTVSPSPE